MIVSNSDKKVMIHVQVVLSTLHFTEVQLQHSNIQILILSTVI